MIKNTNSNPKKPLIPRKITEEILSWLPRPEFIVIKGPRQSGKTTLLNLIRKKIIKKGTNPENVALFNFENRRLLEQFEKDPLTFTRTTADLKSGKRQFIFLDEYQYVKDGGQKLKLIYDTFSPRLKVIITGSSSLELTFQLGKYMVGRIFTKHLFPLTFDEFLYYKEKRLHRIWEEKNKLAADFLLGSRSVINKNLQDIFTEEFTPYWEEYLTYGGYPAVVSTSGTDIKLAVLENIVETYVDRDIVGLLKEESITEFRALARTLAAQTSQLANYEQLAGDTGLYYKKIKHYLSILEETFVIKQIKPFHKNLTTELKKNPKIYFLDSGLRNYLVNNFSEVRFRSNKGALVESAVLSNLIYALGLGLQTEVLFWRTTGGAELDFILRRGLDSYPIEVKYQTLKQPTLTKSLYSYINAYEPERLLVLTKDYWNLTKKGSTEILFAPVFYFCAFTSPPR